MTGTTKHDSQRRIAKNVGWKFARVNALEQFAFGNIVMNVQRMFAASALCGLAALLAITALLPEDLLSPFPIVDSPTVASMMDEWMFAPAVAPYVLGDANGRTFHGGSDADRLVATTSASMSALVTGNPLNGVRGQTFASEVVSLNVSRNAYGFAMFSSCDGNSFSASAGTARPFDGIGQNPIVNRFVLAFHIRLCDLASGELPEPLPGNAEGNQQPSRRYTFERFRDSLERFSPLNNQLRAPESCSMQGMI